MDALQPLLFPEKNGAAEVALHGAGNTSRSQHFLLNRNAVYI